MHLGGCACNRCQRLKELVYTKFSYVCTCQIYGKMKDEQKQQAADIDYLLHKHKGLRVAYVDGPKKVKDGPPRFYSVLIRSMENRIVEGTLCFIASIFHLVSLSLPQLPLSSMSIICYPF